MTIYFYIRCIGTYKYNIQSRGKKHVGIVNVYNMLYMLKYVL